MKLSSPRFKSLAVTAGFTFWFFLISSSIGFFSFEVLGIFILATFIITQIFAVKLTKGLDIFAIINTKIFLGILFVFVISIYGIIFKILHIDPLRREKQNQSYWLNMDQLKQSTNYTQY
jgi:glycosyltransferase involved in cell wall biosynthesis